MIGSELLNEQPFFRGNIFALDDVEAFGFYNFREARVTGDEWNRHEGIEIVFVLSGESCWELPDDSLAMASGGQVVVFPPRLPHRISNGIYTPCSAFWILFRPDLADATTGFLSPLEREAFFRAALVRRSTGRGSEALTRTVMDLCARLADPEILIGGELTKAEIRSMLYSVIVGVWRHLKDDAGKLAAPDFALRGEILTQATHSDDDSIAKLARSSGYSRSYFYDIFSRYVGMPPNDYRQRLRIKRCCTLLTGTDAPVTEIAISNGFSSSQYFSRVFKKYVGISPSQYRTAARAHLAAVPAE